MANSILNEAHERWTEEVRLDVHRVLSHAGVLEARVVLCELVNGRIDGGMYASSEGCGCLKGTLAAARSIVLDNEKIDPTSLRSRLQYWWRRNPSTPSTSTIKVLLQVNTSPVEPAESWFCAIRLGDDPDCKYEARLAADWIQEWIDEHDQTRSPSTWRD